MGIVSELEGIDILDQIKLGIRLFSIIIGVCIWGYVWKFAINTIYDALPDEGGHCKYLSNSDICKVVFSSLWLAVHIFGVMALVCWAWT